ncbi:hypothetical protein Holit_02963 [Hollandina sp. SP2]
MDFREKHEGQSLPPLPGAEQIKQVQPPLDAIPLYIQGMVIPMSEPEALGVITQIASALQTSRAGVVRNG